ncbi:MAG: Brp/Blh family beta-carotene 15,15'-dioxygenase [Cyclobacteriaceae bacterium]
MTFFFKLVVVFISLIIYRLVMGTTMEYVIAFGLILLIGIPHGATDHTLAQFNNGQSQPKRLSKKFLVRYLLIMAGYGLCWFLSPTLSFMAFILLSAYHFGEAQLAYQKNLKLAHAAASLSGVAFLLILLLPHQDEVANYIVPYFVSESGLTWFGSYAPWMLIAIVALLIGCLAINGWRILRKEIIDLILVFIVSYFTSLLFGFAIFFAFWHSWDAAKMQIGKISQIKQEFNLKKWSKEATPFTLISWAGIGLILVLFELTALPWPIITSFFVLVSIITLPHAIIMSRFYKTDYASIPDAFSLEDGAGRATPGGKSKTGSGLGMPPSSS